LQLFKETTARLTSDLVRSYKMKNVEFIKIETSNGITTHAIIDHGNGEFTSMLKSTYDERIANEASAE
jgi:hypothetical protein